MPSASKGSAQPSVAIIVINYNGAAILDDLAASLAGLTYTNYRLYLIDNASTDGSQARLQDLFPNAEIILNEVNAGFANAVNRMAGIALQQPADYVLLLNPDTTLDPDFLDRLAEVADVRTLVCPKVISMETGGLANHAGRFDLTNGLLVDNRDGDSPGSFQSPREVEVATFACVLIPRAAFAAVGPLDERFGMYYEDTDFCLRARKAGFRILIQPAGVIHHRHGASSGGRTSPFILYYSVRNHPYVVRKHASLPGFLLFSAYFLTSHLRRMVRRIHQRDWLKLRVHLMGLRDFYLGRMGMTYQPSDLNDDRVRPLGSET